MLAFLDPSVLQFGRLKGLSLRFTELFQCGSFCGPHWNQELCLQEEREDDEEKEEEQTEEEDREREEDEKKKNKKKKTVDYPKKCTTSRSVSRFALR